MASLEPVARRDGQSLMVLTLEPELLENATNSAVRGRESASDGKKVKKPKADAWARQQAAEVLGPFLPGGKSLPAMAVVRKGNNYEITLLLPTEVARRAMQDCSRRRGCGLRPHIGDY